MCKGGENSSDLKINKQTKTTLLLQHFSFSFNIRGGGEGVHWIDTGELTQIGEYAIIFYLLSTGSFQLLLPLISYTVL